MGKALSQPPKIFNVNWFRQDGAGKFVWPGFGQNMRVLKWIVDRCAGRAHAVKTPLGWAPEYGDLDWRGLESFGSERFADAMGVDTGKWTQELTSHERLFGKIGTKLPDVLRSELASLRQRLAGASAPTSSAASSIPPR